MKRVWSLMLCVALLTCSCARQEDSTVKPLDERPTSQLHVFLKGYAGDYRTDSDRHKGVPAPPIQKQVPKGVELIDLVPVTELDLGRMSLAKAVNQRRSRRDYNDEAFSLEELSYLLWNTQGVQKIIKGKDGTVSSHYRTVPSGGARHPFETYLLINRVDGVKSGIYRYLAVEHKLLPLFGGDGLVQRINDACYGQAFAGNSAVVFVWAAVPYRTEWKYAYISHKMIAIEAGHVCQNLYLSAESINAGVCALLGYNQAEMDGLIGVDGKDEFTIYMATVGKVSD